MKTLCILLLACAGVAHAQIDLGGHADVPSPSDSVLGQARVVFTADADCIVATQTNCTVTSTSPGDAHGAYLGTLLVTSTVTLTAPRNLVLVLSPGRTYNIANQTGQPLLPKGATGVAAPSVAAGSQTSVFSDGTNFYGGTVGAAGASAYQIAVSAGYSGTQAQWLASLQGAAGPAGATGPAGVAGAAGPAGAAGAPGTAGPAGAAGAAATVAVGTTGTGAAGAPAAVTNSGTGNAAVLNFTVPQGVAGAAGAAGAAGPAGAAGAAGSPGAVGPAGPPGPTIYSVTRSVSTSTDTLLASDCSAAGNLVTYTGSGTIAVTLPVTGMTPGCHVDVKALGTSGQVLTFTPAAGTFDTAASISIVFPGDGVFTYTGNSTGITWIGQGGYGVRGAANLTTPNALPFVASPGVINQVAPPTTVGTYVVAEQPITVGTAVQPSFLQLTQQMIQSDGTTVYYFGLGGSGSQPPLSAGDVVMQCVAGTPSAAGASGVDGLCVRTAAGAYVPINQLGPTGPAGPAGSAGPAGPAGPTGSQGPMGINGSAGTQGPAGPQGLPNNSGAGSQSNTLTVGVIRDLACAQSTFTYTGVSAGQVLIPGWAGPSGLQLYLDATAANTVVASFCNSTGADIAAASYTVNSRIANYSLAGSGSVTFTAVNDLASATSTFSIVGLLANSNLAFGLPSNWPAGLIPSVSAPSAGTVAVTVQNVSGAPITGTYTVSIQVAQ